MSRHLHVGVFANPHNLLDAIRECRQSGVLIHDAYGPYPLHELDEALGRSRSRLPVVCFLLGFLGVAFGLWMQYWTAAVNWPLNVGGKPLDSLPAFVPVTFELMVLFAGVGSALFFLLRSRLYPGKVPWALPDGITDDRFALVVEERDASLAPGSIQRIWQTHDAVDHREEWVD